MKNLLKRISINPDICFGRAFLKGTRIQVSLILDFLADDKSPEEITKEYPQLKIDDIRAALSYASQIIQQRQ